MGVTRSVSTLCLTHNLQKTMCAVAFILVNHPVHSHASPGVHRKSSVSKMSEDTGIGNLSISNLYWVNSICCWKYSTCKVFIHFRKQSTCWVAASGNWWEHYCIASLCKEQILFLRSTSIFIVSASWCSDLMHLFSAVKTKIQNLLMLWMNWWSHCFLKGIYSYIPTIL